CSNKVCLIEPEHPYRPDRFGCTSLVSCDWGTRTTTYQQGPLIIDFKFITSVTHKLQMSFTQEPHTRLLVGDVGARVDGGNYGFYFQKQAPSSTATATATATSPSSPTATAGPPTPTPTPGSSAPTPTATATPATPTLDRAVVRTTTTVAVGAGFAAHVKCPAGKVSVGGGYYPDPGIVVTASYPVADTNNPTSSWEVYGKNTSTQTQS